MPNKLDDDINITLLKSYVNKHYHLSPPTHIRNDWKIIDREINETVSEYRLNEYLSKIFNVNIPLIKHVFKLLITEKITEINSKQLKIDL